MTALSRRRFLFGSLSTAVAAALAGCEPRPSKSSRPTEGGSDSARAPKMELPRFARIDEAVERAGAFLAKHQSEDGAWRSDTYGVFKDGTGPTPLVLNALLSADPRHAGIDKASEFLAAPVQADGTIKPPAHGFDFSLYTSALSVTAFSHERLTPRFASVREAWLKYLKDRQLTEDLGWKPEEKPYGGWGYCRVVPRKPMAGEFVPPLLESNLSATTFALAALSAAETSPSDAVFHKARTFVERCQNWHDEEKERDPSFDDGGFFFIYDDDVRNKAGSGGKDRHGRVRYASYGSASADGLRCLTYCGVSVDAPRVKAAKAWLKKHFSPSSHPGAYAERRKIDREALYFYYAASLAQAPLEQHLVETPDGLTRMWIEALADEIMARQKTDGAWQNAAHAQREDDAFVATSFALLALAAARRPKSVFPRKGAISLDFLVRSARTGPSA